MILPIFVFSQKVDNLIVKELILSTRDTLITMPKYHGKKIAIKLAEYPYIVRSNLVKDSIISNYNLTINNFKKALLLGDQVIDNKDVLIDSYREEIRQLNTQVKKSKSKEKWYIIGGLIVGGITVNTIVN